MGSNRYREFREELPVAPPRHTLMLLGGTGTSFTGPIWPLVEINGIKSFSVRYGDMGVMSTVDAINIEIVSDKASVWERDWKKTAEWSLRWSKPEDPAAVTMPKSRRGTASTESVVDANEYLFDYKFPVEPRKHSVLLQESRNGRYVGELWSIAGITGLESFSIRKHGTTTSLRIGGEFASVWKPDWKITPDWHRRPGAPEEPRVPRQSRARTSEAKTILG